MDYNTVVLSGRLAAPAETRTFESGETVIKFLVTSRTDEPRRRIDVIPIVMWRDPETHRVPDDHDILHAPPGTGVFVVAQLQRRFWDGTDGRRSRIEIIARHVTVSKQEEEQYE